MIAKSRRGITPVMPAALQAGRLIMKGVDVI